MSDRQVHHEALYRLTNRYGIALSYHAIDGEIVHTPDETVFAALRAFGVEIKSFSDIGPAYEQRLAEEWSTICDATSVAWDGRIEFSARLPVHHTSTELQLKLKLEDGDERTIVRSLSEQNLIASDHLDDRTKFLTRRVTLPWQIPPGYHRLEIRSAELTGSMLLISAPCKAFQHQSRHSWGTFLPLYSLQSASSWGAGNISDLQHLLEWTSRAGGSYVGTLPLLPAFLTEPFLPSPYSPVSRLFWNEFYIDVERVPEFARSDKARAIVESTEFQHKLTELRSADEVDYREGMRLRRLVLEQLVGTLVERAGDRLTAFRGWLDDNPRALQYARFRAVCERYESGPSGWPKAWSPNQIEKSGYDQSVCNYHAYVQWVADQQLAALPQLPESDVGLYLDLPLGVHPDGYDVWREPDLFAPGFSVGAPPDPLGIKGQNWGFPPLHPLESRNRGYRQFIEVVRHHMRHASMLRIDHIMGLHRQFWIPDGAESKDGIYIHYPFNDLYAILNLESHRNQTELVGEDLGTVPDEVRPAMSEHGINRMIIVPFEIWPDATALASIPTQALVALNTHDIPPFAGIWNSWFNNERQALLVKFLLEEGWLTEADAHDLEAIVSATLESIGASDTRAVLVNLEDLWLETRSQNVPGTTDDEHANWRHKASQTFETFSMSTTVLSVLGRLDAARRQRIDEDVSL